jgi:hypothetical protein
VTLLIYELLVRRWAPARFVFGLRPRSRPAGRPAPTAGPLGVYRRSSTE